MNQTASFPLDRVQPTRPLAPYIGGKRALSKRIVARINTIEHSLYAEPFVGMGGIFLRRDQRPKCEAINDWNDDVANLFRICQHHYVAFLEMMRFQITSRANFEKLAALEPASLTDLQRAARFLYLQRLAFGGKVAGQNFGIQRENGARFDVTKLAPMIEAVHERLSGVTIDRLPWADFIRRWDRPGALFYLDPPYYGNEGDYGRDLFGREEFEQMADVLGAMKGKFLLSINDHPDVRRIFDGFTIDAVKARYTLAGMAKSREFGELLVSG